ncbi:hypothetical protein J4558_06185 [Leptolyngbya sp. 15MV]|nr:hypothetical protein J4558_06185 [Leptolyngbya sp. 15MV]
MATGRALAVLAASALALAACDRSDPAQGESGTRAEGEVLGGSISDEMIPLDQLRSQSPPLRPEATGGAAATTGEAAAPEAETTGEADGGEPAPADEDEG